MSSFSKLFVLMFVAVGVLFSSSAYSTVYYVKQDGDNSLSGLSDKDAWASIFKVNSYNFEAGDTVKFKRNNVFKYYTLFTPGVNNFTIEDYGVGAKPWFNGDLAQPVHIEDFTISNLTIRNIDISGQDWLATKAVNLYVIGVNGVEIDGVEGNGYKDYSGSRLGKNAIQLERCSGKVVVKNCLLYNWGSRPFDTGNDFIALTVMRNVSSSSTVAIYDNVIHDIQADGIQLYTSTSPTKVYNNEVYNCGENSVDNKGTSNVEYYENKFYRESGFTGMSGTPKSTSFPLMAVQTSYGHDIRNIVVRNNEFLATDGEAIQLSGNTPIGETYGTSSADGIFDGMVIRDNNFTSNKYSFLLLYNVNNVSIYNNEINRLKSGGRFYYETNNGIGIEVYSNSFSTSNDIDVGVFLEGSTTRFTDNSFFIQDVNSLVLKTVWGAPEFSGNRWFNTDSSKFIVYKNTTFYKSDVEKWRKLGYLDLFEGGGVVAPTIQSPEEFQTILN